VMGIEEGKSIGAYEAMKLTASNMLKKNLPDSMIMELTNLSQKELDEIKRNPLP